MITKVPREPWARYWAHIMPQTEYQPLGNIDKLNMVVKDLSDLKKTPPMTHCESEAAAYLHDPPLLAAVNSQSLPL